MFNKQLEGQGSVSVMQSFGTFILLSSVKLINVCFDLLIAVKVVDISSLISSTTTLRLYYDASIKYFSKQHLPYATLAIVVLVTNILLPTLLLFFYPFTVFQCFLNEFPYRLRIVLQTFVDSFQGCFKNGVHGDSTDYQYLSAMPFVIRLFT